MVTRNDVVAFLETPELGGKVWSFKRPPDSDEYFNAWSAEKV